MNENFKIIENNENESVDSFYSNFKEKLEQTHTFPTDYVFKYIVPANPEKIAQIHKIFENSESTFSTRDSKTGKYTSITIKTHVNDANDVIIYYRQVAKIDGVVML